VNAVALVAVVGCGAGAAGVAGLVRRPTRPLAPRVRPYAVASHSALVGPGALAPADVSGGRSGTLPRLFGPVARAGVGRIARVVESRGDDVLAAMLRRAGLHDVTPDEFRVRQATAGVVGAVVAGVAVGLITRMPVLALVAAAAAFLVRATRVRSRVERAVAARAARIRLELYTVNHLIAMHVRTGAGVMQALQRVVARGRGVVVDELRDVLTWSRSGMAEADALRRAAELTAEPAAARTYQLLASGAERGIDLGVGLLALSADLREARREQLHKDAVRRRAMMLVPTIAILAPIMLLFIGAPLPSLVFGNH